MAVLVRETTVLNGEEVETRVYKPSGRLSKEDRKRADRLDEVLADRIPSLGIEIDEELDEDYGLLRERYLLGKKLRDIVDDRELVKQTDVDNGYIWEAVWQYLPDSLRPAGSTDDESYSDRENRREGMFSLSYKLSDYGWSEIAWIERWHDWYELASRPGVLRDHRVLEELGNQIQALDEYPDEEEFQRIVKGLTEAFPTRRFRESRLLDDETIREDVEEVVRSAVT